MKELRPFSPPLALAGVLLFAGCSPGAPAATTIPNGEASPGSAAQARSFQIEPGGFAEANFTMKKGATFTATFSEGADDLAWDVHSHDHGGGTKIHDAGTGGQGSATFMAPEDGVFSMLWRNPGETVSALEVSVSLSADAEVHSWMPASAADGLGNEAPQP